MKLFRKNRKDEEIKEETLESLKEKESDYRHGVAGGITGAVVGGLTAGSGYLASRLAENPKNKNFPKIDQSKTRLMKGSGLAVAGLGTGLAAYGAVKRRKVVSKIKEKEDADKKKE